MFPIEFDHRMLDSLPLPGKDDSERVVHIAKATITRRIIPYFRKKRGTEPTVTARIAEHLKIERLEDNSNRVRVVSLISRMNDAHSIHIHERIFDYLAFVIPSDPESTLGDGTSEQRTMLAFTEMMLRHEMEMLLYPQGSEREAIESDAAFAMARRDEDPTFYRMLRSALSDEMNGLNGNPYLALFDYAEQERPHENLVKRILDAAVTALVDFPDEILERFFPSLDRELQSKVLGRCYRISRDTSYSLLNRNAFLRRLLRLFVRIVDDDEKEAEGVFQDFKDRWGLVYLFQELDLPENTVENKGSEEIFQLFKDRLKVFSDETSEHDGTLPPAPTVAVPDSSGPTVRSLKDRIEEARQNPLFPAQVMELIDKNKLNAVGHSGSKYSELIETLLAFPWGRIETIEVTAGEFERGLNDSHYGLAKPKEIICDFFANLIWRYDQFKEENAQSWAPSGSAFLFVGPPGVGKTSLAISIAENLGIPYHKLSLGGMRDEADLRGHGFTYEGSKPGAIVQGIIKMGSMSGMFIMDEADKTEKFAIATLLEILDPEQNHLFHDKYTQTTVDIDLSNCHFILTANTLETVPPPVINRCEVVMLDRYSVEEKVNIAKEHLIRRVRRRYQIGEEQISIDPDDESDLLKYLIKTYTYEPGVRELERIIRTLFLRVLRKEILSDEERSVVISREKIKQYLDAPRPPRQINETDRVGESMALGVNVERGVGSLVPIQATPIRIGGRNDAERGFLSMVHATGNIEKIMDESRRVALTAILHCAEDLEIEPEAANKAIHLHFMGGSTPKDGPSAGGAIALALASVLSGHSVRRDVAMTGEIDTQGRITAIGGLDVKLETAFDAGCRTMLIPSENLLGEGGIEQLSDPLKRELQILTYDAWKDEHELFEPGRQVLQVVAVDHILQAADIAFIDEGELAELEKVFVPYARSVFDELSKRRMKPNSCFQVVFVKESAELHLDNADNGLWEKDGCHVLAAPVAIKEISHTFNSLDEQRKLRGFDPRIESVAEVIEEMAGSAKCAGESPVESSLVAPFFFLQRNMGNLDGFCPRSGLTELRLFANNYSAQGLKIKGCKPVLNRVFAHLARLGSSELEACPFLKKRDGIYMVNMSFIPEKYRLDVKRAEKIVNECLTKWLATVEAVAIGGGSDVSEDDSPNEEDSPA
jgi:endopeptidase La